MRNIWTQYFGGREKLVGRREMTWEQNVEFRSANNSKWSKISRKKNNKLILICVEWLYKSLRGFLIKNYLMCSSTIRPLIPWANKWKNAQQVVMMILLWSLYCLQSAAILKFVVCNSWCWEVFTMEKWGQHHKASLKWNPQVKHIRHECLFIWEGRWQYRFLWEFTTG